MFEDIIGNKIWNYKKYKKNPYCLICDSTYVESPKDYLRSKKLVKEMVCLDCGYKWQEVYHEKDLELELDYKK